MDTSNNSGVQEATSPIDKVDPASSGGLLSLFGGVLSKAADTALDIYKEKNTKGNTIGTVYPTGQADPATARTQAQAQTQAVVQSQSFRSWLIAGGAALAGVVVLVLVLKRK